jgi:glycosyltransferase involved in cell wall biosynthesis
MEDLTALILTYNEEANIARALSSVSWIPHVVVIDSGSTDKTIEIAKDYPNVAVVHRAFDTFANQCNFGLSQIKTEWVLSLDADYVLTPDLIAEVRALRPTSDVAGYAAEFRYCIFGRPLRSSLYPARTILYRRQLAQYRDEGHGHRVVVRGEIKKLAGKIDHDDRKPLSRWIYEQDRYAKIEARHLLGADDGGQKSEATRHLKVQDKLRKMIFIAPIIMPIYLLFGRGLVLDGWRGWYYVAQRTIAELLLSIRLLIEKHRLENPK